jgi:hypothetical protein
MFPISSVLVYNANNQIGGPIGYNRSNLPTLNICNIYLLMEEVKVSSHVTTTAGSSFSFNDLLLTISHSLIPNIDKNEFNRQIEQSRVLLGKEPFKWDWILINEMLDHSFTSTDRVSEALKTKWIRRISGFFRCSSDEKGYFANMEWDPNNLQYLECACNLYNVLMKDENGLTFLTQDRRGMIFNEIGRELELLTINASNKTPFYVLTNPIANNNTNNGPKMVFRLHSCNYYMAREFFTLLGRILRNSRSRRLLDHTNIFNHLTVLGQYHSLDYLSRLVITSLSFTDGGTISRHLYQFWTADVIEGSCSKLLKEYLYNLLRVLIRCNQAGGSSSTSGGHHTEFANVAEIESVYLWCVEAIVSQLAIDDDTTNNILTNDSLMILYKGMTECLHSRTCAQLILQKRPRFLLTHYNQLLSKRGGHHHHHHHHHANNGSSNVTSPPPSSSSSTSSSVSSSSNSSSSSSTSNTNSKSSSSFVGAPSLLRRTTSAGTPNDEEGSFIQKEMIIHNILIRLMGFSEGISFLSERNMIETIISSWLTGGRGKEYVEGVEDRINNAILEIQSFKSIHSSYSSNNSTNDLLSILAPVPIKIPEIAISTQNDVFSSENGTSSKSSLPKVDCFNPNANLDIDFHGLLRVPWNIETKLINHSVAFQDTNVSANTSGEYVRLDSFLGKLTWPLLFVVLLLFFLSLVWFFFFVLLCLISLFSFL